MQRQSQFRMRLYVTLSLSFVLLFAFAVQVDSDFSTASRAIKVIVLSTDQGIEIDGAELGGPAHKAGLKPRDKLLSINQKPVRELADYDNAAADFRRGRPVTFTIERDGRQMDLMVSPGIPVDVFPLFLNSFTLLCFLGLMWLIHRETELVARLLYWFAFLVAFEMAQPSFIIGNVHLPIIVEVLHYVITGAQLGVELHLACLIPKRRQFLTKRPWLVPFFYIAGAALSLFFITSTLIYYLGQPENLQTFFNVSYYIELSLLPIWAVLVLGILVGPAFSYPEKTGRNQALLVFLGILPWAIYAFVSSLPWAAADIFLSQGVFHLTQVIYLAAIFWAILRYQLIDIEMVVRRGMLYSILTLLVAGCSYLLLSFGGAVVGRLTGQKQLTIWLVGAVALMIGLFFAPLRGVILRMIDRRLFPDRERLRERLTSLAGELPALGKMEVMGTHLVEKMREIFGAKTVALFIANPHSGAFGPSAIQGGEESLGHVLIAPDDPGLVFLGSGNRTQKASVVFKHGLKLQHKLESLKPSLLVPLDNMGTLIGFLVIGEKRAGGRYPAEQIDLLNLLAQHVAIVFENVRLFQSATYDSLTGLLRREAILDLLSAEMRRALRHERPLTIGVADLDHFKPINDRFGHLEGDRLLHQVSKTMIEGMRQSDKVGRYGGEEFLIIFPDTDLNGAVVVANKIRQRMEQLEAFTETGQPMQARISIGLASLSAVAMGCEVTTRDLIAAADRALYQAKDRGRNRVVVYEKPKDNLEQISGNAG